VHYLLHYLLSHYANLVALCQPCPRIAASIDCMLSSLCCIAKSGLVHLMVYFCLCRTCVRFGPTVTFTTRKRHPLTELVDKLNSCSRRSGSALVLQQQMLGRAATMLVLLLPSLSQMSMVHQRKSCSAGVLGQRMDGPLPKR